MATIEKMLSVAGDATWNGRVRQLVIKAAIAVIAEDVGTVNHANRIAYAKKILAGSVTFAVWATAVLTNATIAASADPSSTSDNDLEFTINSMFNAFADSAV
jgi:hypothetical protein